MAPTLPSSLPQSVAVQAVVELVSATDYRFDLILEKEDPAYELPEELREQLYEALPGNGGKVGGYAYFTQEDPRAWQDVRDADGASAKGEWLLLLQMDTHGDDIMWGDCGVANWFIREADLANLDFSHVWYNWDCS